MEINFFIFAAVALLPLIIGAIWYNPKVFGSVWLNSSGLTEERAQSGNMLVIFGLTYVFSFLLTTAMMSWSIHQFNTQSLFIMQEGFAEQTGEYYTYFQDFMQRFGNIHRSFGHGAVHGIFAGATIALPIISILALFERRGWKYILVHFGYWLITLVLMCGSLCHFA